MYKFMILFLVGLAWASPLKAQVSGQTQTTINLNNIPTVGTDLPRTEVVGGANNSAIDPMVAAPMFHQHPRISRSKRVTVAAQGLISVTWLDPLPTGAASYPVYFTPIGAMGTAPLDCMVISATNTGFSAQCRQPILGLVTLGAISNLAAAGSEVFALQLPSTEYDVAY